MSTASGSITASSATDIVSTPHSYVRSFMPLPSKLTSLSPMRTMLGGN